MKHTLDPILLFALATTTWFFHERTAEGVVSMFLLFFVLLRPWKKSHSVCIRGTVIFVSTYLTDVFREDPDYLEGIFKIERAGTLRSVSLRQNQMYCLSFCPTSATKTEKTCRILGPCLGQQV